MKNQNKIKELRKKAKLSQKELANKVNISNQAISFYENGKRLPKIETWQKLANFFGVSVSYLQGIEPDYSKSTDKTEITIIKLLNDCYFEKNNNDWQGIDIWNALDVRDAVNRYAEHSKISFNSLLNKDSLNITFWQKNFSFVLRSEKVIETANMLIDKKAKLAELMSVISNCINKKDEDLHDNDFSDHLAQKYNGKIYGSIGHLIYDLRFASNLADINLSFKNCFKYLKQIQMEINTDIKSGNFEHEIEYEKPFLLQPIKYHDQAKRLYKEDKDFREFYSKSEYLIPVKIYDEYLKMKHKEIPELSKYIENNPELNKKKNQ